MTTPRVLPRLMTTLLAEILILRKRGEWSDSNPLSGELENEISRMMDYAAQSALSYREQIELDARQNPDRTAAFGSCSAEGPATLSHVKALWQWWLDDCKQAEAGRVGALTLNEFEENDPILFPEFSPVDMRAMATVIAYGTIARREVTGPAPRFAPLPGGEYLLSTYYAMAASTLGPIVSTWVDTFLAGSVVYSNRKDGPRNVW